MLRSARRASRRALAAGFRFGCEFVFSTTLAVGDVTGRACCGRSRAECTVVPVLVVAGTAVRTPPSSRGSGTRLGASLVVGRRARAASVTAAPAAAAPSAKARPRRGRVAAPTASAPDTPGWGVAARGTAVGNCRSRASACSRSSGETSTASGLIGSAGSSVGSRDVGTATIHHCACARRRTVVRSLGRGPTHSPANLSTSRTVRTRILKSSHGDQFSM
jgi:hypothetical protein